jgi:protein involved in polysaccharide export with SLBB domain
MIRHTSPLLGRSLVILAVVAVLLVTLSATGARSQEYAARAGDVLDVVVIGDGDLSRLVTVSPEGSIFLPMVGNVNVVGLTLKQIEDRLVDLLKKFIKEPKVVVTLRQGTTDKDFVYVLGQVTRPGPYEFRRGWTVAELLAMAGGAAPHAALRRAVVLRRSVAIPIDLEKLLATGDTSQNPELKPGDVLVVPELNERVLVLGEVAQPGYQDLKEGDRIIDTLTRAGGPTIKAAPEGIAIMRNGQPVKVSLEVFLRQGDMDQNVLMQAGDVVNVPETDRRVLVMGEVAKPGRYFLETRIPSRVLDALMMAGGPNKGAKLSAAMVIRQVSGKPASIPVNLEHALKNGSSEQNIVVRPGDVVYVPTGFQVQLHDVLQTISGMWLLRWFFGIR